MYGGAVSWSSKKQRPVAQSTMEAEYYACNAAAREAAYLRGFAEELGFPISQPIQVFNDNQACLLSIGGEAISEAAKHIEVRYHYIRDCAETGQIAFAHLGTDHMIADSLTKNLGKVKVEQHRTSMLGARAHA